MRSCDQTKKAIQVCCDRVQLPRTTYQCIGKRLTKNLLGGHHIHFHRTLVDCTPEVAQLKRHRGTVDLEMRRGIFRTFASLGVFLFCESSWQAKSLLLPDALPNDLTARWP